ncbi:MAG: LamG-like jellyroll fold domain-containing protein [Roseibacillus sp.]
MKTSFKFASLLLASSACFASAKTILVDIAPTNAGGSVASTTAHFAANDSNILTTATPTVITTWAALGAATVTDEDAASYTITTTGIVNGGYNAGDTSWTDNTPIVEGYIYDRDTTIPNTVTIAGVAQFPAGELITLTIYGIGDNVAQETDFTATYNGTTTATQTTEFGNDRLNPTNSVTFVQFTFVSDATADDLTFTWNRKGAPSGSNNNASAGLNGFSITSSVPTFGDVTAATLSAPNTTFIVGAPEVDLSATGTFTTAGTIDVTALGSSVVSYSSNNTSVATVSSGGEVTVIQPGSADITATVLGDNGTSVTTSAVTFVVEEPTNFNFIPLADEINPNYLLSYGANVTMSVSADSASLSGVVVDNYTGFTLSSSDTGVAVFDVAGVLAPLDPGSAAITAELLIPGGSSFSEAITVTTEDADSITATVTTQPANTLYVGGSNATIILTVTTPNIATPIEINNIAGTVFSTDSGSDIAVNGASGLLTPGTNTNSLGDSVITAAWELSGGSLISDTITITLALPPLKPTTLMHCYEFTGTAGAAALENTSIADTVGTADAVVLGTGAIFNADGSALVLPGGANAADGAYVDLPDGIISTIPNVDTLGLTFETWMTKDATNNWMRAVDFGTNTEPVSFANIIAHRSGSGNLASEFTTDRPALGTQFVTASAGLTVGERSYLVMTIDPETGIRMIYLNGMLISNDILAIGNRSIAAIADVNNWLGRSNANTSDPRFGGSFDEFCIYSGIMTADEVAANFAAALEGLGICVTSYSGGSLNVDLTGLGIDTVYHFQGYNTATSQFEAIAGTEFTATAAAESKAIDTAGLGDSKLIRLSEGPVPAL